VSIPADASQEIAIGAAQADANVQKFMEGKPVRKAIYVAGKLVNIVV
jgi:leucyl-tRNA synthetase